MFDVVPQITELAKNKTAETPRIDNTRLQFDNIAAIIRFATLTFACYKAFKQESIDQLLCP